MMPIVCGIYKNPRHNTLEIKIQINPYLNPVEEVWSVLKGAMSHSVRYADMNAHLTAVYEFIKIHKFDYDFKKFWNRKPPKGIMRPFIKVGSGLPNSCIISHQVSS